MLDVPVPLMEEQLLVDVFAYYDIPVPEQVIEVPKILIDDISVRTLVREPQLAEQLVEVPTILSFLNQTAYIPVPRGGGRRLQGFLPEQNPTAQSVQLIDIPVPGRGGGGVRGGLQSPLPGQNTTAQSAQIVDFPVLRGQGFLPGQGSTASSFYSPADDVDEPFEGGFSALLPGPKKTARVAAHSSAELGAHSSSSTLVAHQMAPVPSCDDFEMIEEEAEGEEEVEEEEEFEMFDESIDRFEHSSFRPKRLCRQFMAGRCEAGWSYTFAHGEQELHPAALRRADRVRASAADHG